MRWSTIAWLVFAAACNFKVDAIPAGTDDGGSGDLGGADGPSGIDLSGGCTAKSTACDGDGYLVTCNDSGTAYGNPTMCPYGCAVTPTAHCKVFTPSGDVSAANDLTATGPLIGVTVTGNATLNGNTGEITGSIARAANGNPGTPEDHAGIPFH